MKAQHGHHITPKKTLFFVFGALIVLTIVTALTAQIDLGVLNVPLAIAIASSKAALVAMFFMALKYDNPVNTLVFSLGVIFVAVFLIFTLFDTVFRGDLGNVGTTTISDIERMESLMRDREADLSEHIGNQLDLVGTGQADDGAGADTAAADTAAADTTAGNGGATGGDGAADNEADDAQNPDGQDGTNQNP